VNLVGYVVQVGLNHMADQTHQSSVPGPLCLRKCAGCVGAWTAGGTANQPWGVGSAL